MAMESLAARADLAHLAAPPALEHAGEMPVGSLDLPALRSDFRETAVWLPQLRTGPDGEGRASFRLPGSLTSYRLSAVALTRRTEIGTGRVEIRATLPLSAEIALPRFAVEGDRLAAIGLVHNNGPRDRTCVLLWEIEGAGCDGLLEGAVESRKEADGGKTVLRGRLKVPAGKSARIAFPLLAQRAGSARLTFRVHDPADGAKGDGEARTLPILYPGRERSVAVDSSFRGKTSFRLPSGFTARDLRVVLAAGDPARALDGLAGLVDYPYGCVEQTMSRFLPAVLAREAVRRTPLTLPSDVEAKLPQVLERGLARLYNFQHQDGGWGWWEHDKTDPRMTIYVVGGLALCRSAHVAVDEGVLERGCGWLRTELHEGRLKDEMEARAHLALALAGKADPGLRSLGEQARRRGNPEICCLLALACRPAGLAVAEELWARVRDWKPEDAGRLALFLKAQLMFGAGADECRRTAGRLMKLRRGLGWSSTEETAAALDALSLMLSRLPGEAAVKGLRVTVAGRTVLNLSRPEDLKHLVFRARVSGEGLPAVEQPEITLSAEGEVPIFYTLEATGNQRLDRSGPVGDEVKVTRSWETPDGKPIRGPVTVGQVVAVRLRLALNSPETYLLIEDRRPAGCEFVDERLHGAAARSLANIEFRDDRVCAFAGSLPAGTHEFVYYLRARTPGISNVLPGVAYPMYNDGRRGETGAAKLEVVERR
jgi:uncharacterized protein YfaS (alpha-2-macroglobulin family)